MSFQARLLEDTVERARSQIVAGFPRNRYPARFRQVLELTVTAPRRYQEPSVVVQQAQQFTDFHPPTLELAASSANVSI